MRILCLQGPNLNLLGTREPEVYGDQTLEHVQARLDQAAERLGIELEHFQSNVEGFLIDRIHLASRNGIAGCVINPGAYGHSSIGIRDAFVAADLPFVEVHISNVHGREPFRQQLMLAGVAVGLVTGLGVAGYELALVGLVEKLRG